MDEEEAKMRAEVMVRRVSTKGMRTKANPIAKYFQKIKMVSSLSLIVYKQFYVLPISE